MSNLQIQNVRLSYPNLWKAKAMEQGQEPKFSAAFILDKKLDAKQIAAIQAAMKVVAEEKWGAGKVPKGVKYCLRDGGEQGRADTDGYGPDKMFFNANSVKRIPVVDRNLAPLDEQSGKPYAGCFVNVSIKLWAQDNQYGKRVNAQLRAVQFVKDGPAFGEAPVDVSKEFTELPEDDSSLE